MLRRTWILHCSITLLLSLPLLGEEVFEKKPESLLPLTPPSGWENTSASEWAKLLRLPLESETKYQSSYRVYLDQGDDLLGARPRSISLVATEDQPDQLTIMFANKGDSASTYLRANAAANASLKDITEIKRLIQADYDIVKKNMSDLLEKPSTQGFGEAGKAREFPLRWDYQGTTFLLTERPGEYCVLRILPSSSADQGGKTSRISDSAMRERMKNNVVHRPNGDVIIENIPMVDQGPKGFCVPATYTRALLYAGVPADLYLLALLGRTDVGGGTSLSMLRNLPLDTVKIDKALIDPLPGREGTAVVEAICKLAAVLGLGVVAEGVETAKQADTARRAGCNELQGYYFNKPLSAEDAGKLLH